MPEIPMIQKTPVVWADTTDYSSAISSLIRTAQLDLTGILAGAAREGAQVNLGTNRAHEYLIFVGLEFAAAAVIAAGEKANIYFGQSSSSNPANGNPGELTGVDADYAPANPNLEAGLQTLGRKFDMTLDDRVTPEIQFQMIGRIITPMQFIIPTIRLATATAVLHTDAVECLIALLPLLPESQ